MTDPRAALAEALHKAFVWERDLADGSPSGMPDFPRTVERLAERGVLLVTEVQLQAAVSIAAHPDMVAELCMQEGSAIFAALSAEVTE